jgi:hypothetical protein
MLAVTDSKLSFREIKKKIERELHETFQTDIDDPQELDRVAKISRAKRNYLYWQGKQYLKPKLDTSDRTIDWISVLDDRSKRKNVKYCSVYNIIQSDGLKFVAVVGQRKPNQKCVADNPDDEDMTELARDGDAALRHLHLKWKIAKVVDHLAFTLWSVGPAFGHTHYVTDAQRHGYIEIPDVSVEHQEVSPAGYRCGACGTKTMEPFCPQCGEMVNEVSYESAEIEEVPRFNGIKKYENGGVELDIYNLFHVNVSAQAKERKDTDYLTHSEMLPEYQIRAMYGDKVAGILQNFADEESVAAREADRAVQEVSSDRGTRELEEQDRYIHERRWVRPVIYHAFGPRTRKLLLGQFPDGLRTTFVGKQLVEAEHEKLDDFWSICKTGTGEHLTSPALCDPIIPIQNDINDFMNLGKETIVRAIPKTLVASELFDRARIQEEDDVQVAEMIPVKIGPTDISKQIGQLPMSRFSDQMMPLYQIMRDMSREGDGIQPAIFGGGEAANTWRAESQRKNQALMQLQPPFQNINDFITEVSDNGIRELAKNGSGNVTVPPKLNNGLENSYTFTIHMLKDKGWHVEAAESAPISYAEKVDRIVSISTENPDLAVGLGFQHPMNAADMQDFFGVDGLYVPGSYEQQKVMKRIKDLLAEEPMVVGFDPMTGQPMEEPTIQPDPILDKPVEMYAELFRTWCNSPAGQAQKDMPGFRNVYLHLERLEMMLQEQMMAAAMPPEEGGEEAPPQGGGEAPATIPPVTDSPAPLG